MLLDPVSLRNLLNFATDNVIFTPKDSFLFLRSEAIRPMDEQNQSRLYCLTLGHYRSFGKDLSCHIYSMTRICLGSYRDSR